MTATEWGGRLEDDGYAAGDAVLARGFSRSFLTTSAGGFPQVITVLAVPALVDPGADVADRHARRDVLEVTTVDTYLLGAVLGETEPFDSEVAYAWPVDYWPATALRRDGQPRLAALRATARAHITGLPQAWIDAMPAPPAGFHAPS